MTILNSYWKGFYSDKDVYSYSLIDHHKGGFFACTFSALNSIVLAYNSCKILPYSVNIDDGISMSCEESKDLYDMFFCIDESINVHELLSVYSDPKLNRFKVPIIFASRPYREQNFKAICPLWEKYFSPSFEIKSLTFSLIEKYKIDVKTTLGVYYRGTDKAKEEQLPLHKEYIEKTLEVLAKGEYSKVLLQTDDPDFKDLFLGSINNSVMIQELQVSRTGDGVHKELRLSNTGQTENSKYMLSVVCLFSQLKSIIINTSHVSHAMCLYRGGVTEVLQYRRGEWIK